MVRPGLAARETGGGRRQVLLTSISWGARLAWKNGRLYGSWDTGGIVRRCEPAACLPCPVPAVPHHFVTFQGFGAGFGAGFGWALGLGFTNREPRIREPVRGPGPRSCSAVLFRGRGPRRKLRNKSRIVCVCLKPNLASLIAARSSSATVNNLSSSIRAPAVLKLLSRRKSRQPSLRVPCSHSTGSLSCSRD